MAQQTKRAAKVVFNVLASDGVFFCALAVLIVLI